MPDEQLIIIVNNIEVSWESRILIQLEETNSFNFIIKSHILLSFPKLKPIPTCTNYLLIRNIGNLEPRTYGTTLAHVS